MVLKRAVTLGNLLVQAGLVTEEQVQAGLAEQARTHERIGEILRRLAKLTDAQVQSALGQQLGLDQFQPTKNPSDPTALDLVPVEFARRHNLLPIRLQPDALVVAMVDPLDVEARDHLEGLAHRHHVRLKIHIAQAGELATAREALYAQMSGNRQVNQLIDLVADELGSADADADLDEDSAQRRAEEAGVVSLVDKIIGQALQERATDIHIEPLEGSLVIRYRVDGILQDALRPPLAVYTGVVSRIKILAKMDIAERRMTQDGRLTHRVDGREIDIRVSLIPTIHGEKLVLRLLDKSSFNFKLMDLGFSDADYRTLKTAIHHPHGMILLSGPTGSGKTTTLYASLLELHDNTLNITTIEDPVEYQIARISQVQLNARKQVTFPNALRAFLRQDPDVIMLGEIRDLETAEIAIKAALTGHLVFSTIHANDAPSTAVRLIAMGVEPFMSASALTLVAAQRLIRRNCPHCLEEYRPTDEVLATLADPELRLDAMPAFRRGAGCPACKGRGYSGRVAIVELMSLNADLREAIAGGAPAGAIRKVALANGMVPLRRAGLAKVRDGISTVEEVLRVCLSDD